MAIVKKYEIALLFFMVFMISFSQVPQVRSAESIEEDVSLGFLKNVVGLDIEKYNVEVRVGTNAPLPASSIPTKDRVVKLSMTSAESKVSVMYFLRNDLVVW